MRGADGKARETRLCLRGEEEGGDAEDEEEVAVEPGKGALKEKVEVEGARRPLDMLWLGLDWTVKGRKQ
jgi:hypothetical protein